MDECKDLRYSLVSSENRVEGVYIRTGVLPIENRLEYLIADKISKKCGVYLEEFGNLTFF